MKTEMSSCDFQINWIKFI